MTEPKHKKYNFGIADGMECLMWLSQAYPAIFKEWVCVRETQPEPEMRIGEWEEA